MPHGRGRLLGRLLLAGTSGLALGLAFPPYGWWPLLAPAVAGVTLACAGLRARAGALVGLVSGLAFFLVLLRWATVIGTDAWIGLSLLQALAWALLGAALAVLPRLPAWPVWAAAAWLLMELIRSTVPFGGFPWGRLAFAAVDTPVLPWAAVAGAPAVSFVVALLGSALAAVLYRPRRLLAWAGAAAAVGVVAGVALAVPLPQGTDAGGRSATVAAVQGNVPRAGLDFLGQREAVLRNHVEATRTLARQVQAGDVPAPELVIWPENSSDIDPFANPDAGARISAAVADIGVPVLVGTLVATDDRTRVENTGIVWDPVDGPGERYVKRHPVPFGEYIPFRSLLAPLIDRLDRIPRDFVAGPRPGVLEVGPAVVGDVICFEIAYDSLVRDVVVGGADLLVVQTNNATYGFTGQPQQQFAISRLRAVEHGRALVVAATSGVSGIVRPDGSVAAQAGEFERALLVTDVPLRTQTTLATRLGPWPEWAAALAGLLATLTAWRRRPRTTASGAPAPGRRPVDVAGGVR